MPLRPGGGYGSEGQVDTSALFPCSTTRELPSWSSHSRIVWSKLHWQRASIRNSRPVLYVILFVFHGTPLRMPQASRDSVASSSHSLTLPSSSALASPAAVGGKGQSPHQVGMPRASARSEPSGLLHLPQPNRCPRSRHWRAGAIRLPGQREDRTRMRQTPRGGCPASHPRAGRSHQVPTGEQASIGGKARQVVPLICQTDQSRVPLATSHSLTLLSRLPLASGVRPS